MATTEVNAAARARRHALGPTSPITERQRQVLRARCRGLTYAEIGRALFIGEQTVKNHFTRVLRKLGVRTACEACFDLGVEVGKRKAEG